MSSQVKKLKMDEGSGTSFQRKSTPPKKICNLSTQKFIDITKTTAFVDKSLFIKTYLEANDDVIVAVAPRRFGKSINMDMLKEFLSGNKEVFEKNQLKIWKEEETFFNENCQKNPIIHVDFKRVGGQTEDRILSSLKTVLGEAYNDHSYLVRESGDTYIWSHEKLKHMNFTIKKFMNYWQRPEVLSRDDIIDGFKYLSQCLYVYHEKHVYVLIDEYDAPILEAIMDTDIEQNIVNKIIKLISAIMSSLLKGNSYVKRGLINACVRIAEVLSKGANNIMHYEFLRKASFVGYYGFTAQEVQELFERDEFVSFRNDDKIQQWYNGYKVTDSEDTDLAIYSPYSILMYLKESSEKKKPMFGRYWLGSGYITNIKMLFAKWGIRRFIEELINGEEIKIETVDKLTKEHVQTLKALVHENSNEIETAEAHLFIQFLLDNGYLNLIKREEESDLVESTVKIPNKEIRTMFIASSYDAKLLRQKYNIQPEQSQNYTDAIKSVSVEGNKDAFIRLANAVSDLFKCKMPNNEDELHSLMFAFVYIVKLYEAGSELSVERRKGGKGGRLDILVIRERVGMIIEVKFKKECSEKAYEQIETSGYLRIFDKPEYKHVTKKILVGLHMDENRKVSITYKVDGSDKDTITSEKEE